MNTNSCPVSNIISCPYCLRKYRSKFNFDRHITGCAFFSKSMKEQVDEVEANETIPTSKDMYRFMQEMAVRITSLEDDNLKLKQQLNKKLHILDWLNTTSKPTIYFDNWFKSTILHNIPNMLETVFNTNLINGINTLFNNEFDSNCSDMKPIRAFNHHTSSLFIYEKQETGGKWIKISAKDLIPWFQTLCKQFVLDFHTHWCQKHAAKLESDETYKDLYIGYYGKILGNNTDCNIIYNKIRLNIFHKIKENISLVN